MDWFGAAGFGLSLFEGYENTKAQREQAGILSSSVTKQLGLLSEQEGFLKDTYAGRLKSATDAYGNQLSTLLDRTNIETSQSGLAFSGTINANSNRQVTTLKDRLGSNLFELNAQKQTEFGQISAQRMGLESEKKIYEQQKQQKFLGIF